LCVFCTFDPAYLYLSLYPYVPPLAMCGPCEACVYGLSEQ